MFDVLTYQKGAAVLRMLEQYLGADAFRAGISLYLKKHEFANTETTDLWDAIEEASRQPARALMDSWVFQPGYPLLHVQIEGNAKCSFRSNPFAMCKTAMARSSSGMCRSFYAPEQHRGFMNKRP